MLKLNFSKTTEIPETKFEIYTDITRIPFSIVWGEPNAFTPTIYTRSLSNRNFIELRFDEESKQLCDITAVSLNATSRHTDDYHFECNETYNVCSVIEDGSILESTSWINVIRHGNSIRIEVLKEPIQESIYRVSENLFLGVNENSFLTSVILSDLTAADLVDIFGG